MGVKKEAETLLHNYHVAVMPDGQEVMMEQLSDGSWVTVESRLHPPELEEVWADTDTVPANFEKKTSEAVFLDHGKVLANAQRTRAHCEAYLVEILGVNPNDLVTGKRAIPAMPAGIKRHVVGLIKVLGMPSWNAVLPLLGETK